MTLHETAHPHSSAVQDYLRAIYQLSLYGRAGGSISTSQLAERLAVRPASVTAMLQKMAATTPALVNYHKSHGVRLTADGELAALSLVRSHRLLECFLHEKLGYNWDEVHEEADRLEHVISDEMADRMAAALGNPTHDPHGHAIPTADLALEQGPGRPLSEILPGEKAAVQYVRDENPELLRYFAEIGLRPGAPVALIRRDAPADLMWLQVNDGAPFPISPMAAGLVFITLLNS